MLKFNIPQPIHQESRKSVSKKEMLAVKSSFKTQIMHFPGGTVVKNPPANAGDTGSSPGPGRSHVLRSN
ncbi:hypothetical protein J1605_020451 [Eschrichtius robustus]|uniref:Uncharacterized protein n=1 Tax=Eschrichtius robustus TaxID=9764 RepID=A0AB34HJR3_ESCRO|nr:hypothetical protein J1605_020451 [Eschrichtius robustus]